MTVQKLKPAPAKVGRLTPKQVGIAMADIQMRLHALERVSIMLQVDLLEDPRDVDAMHTVTQSVLQATGYITELVARGVDRPVGFRGDNPMEWFMPPVYFPSEEEEKKSAA